MKKWLAVLAMTGLVSACSMQPHTIAVVPQLDFAAVNGIEKPIQVDVVDKREHPERLGFRNAKNEGEILFDAPLAETLKADIIKALQQQGAVTGKTPEPATQLTIEIRTLSYVTPNETWVNEIALKGEIALIIQRGATTMRKTFTADQSQDVVTAPSRDYNESYFNLLLTTLVNKALNDREVIGLIK